MGFMIMVWNNTKRVFSSSSIASYAIMMMMIMMMVIAIIAIIIMLLKCLIQHISWQCSINTSVLQPLMAL